jgi:hypothetical protein
MHGGFDLHVPLLCDFNHHYSMPFGTDNPSDQPVTNDLANA